MQEGFNYLDTAHGYLGGKSETACPQHLEIRNLLEKVSEIFDRE